MTMKVPRIAELPATLASQIAAGEVIERPAAVVKELLDNSIDAGADNVAVTISEGGHRLISVSDDGHGIHPDDMQLALRRHSTSKLNTQSDLDCINSLGFRGEALASIAAVSGFLLVSRTAQSDSAWSLSFDPVSGNSILKPAARSRGTTIESADIFQATPARRKFLRSRTTEFLHISEVFKRVACSRFNITFTLAHNNKPVLRYRACPDDMTERVADVFGHKFSSQSIPVNYESPGMRLWGWLGGSSLSRSQSDRQFCFVNGRVIRDKKIFHAVRSAFDDSLPVGRYPTYLLNLDIDPSVTDINVHPTKSEIRFKDIRGVHDFIHISLLDALKSAQSPGLNVTGDVSETRSAPHPGPRIHTNKLQVREAGLFYKNIAPGDGQDDLLDKRAGLGAPLAALSGRLVIAQRDQEYVLLDYQSASEYVLGYRLGQEYLAGSVRQRPLLVPVHMETGPVQVELVEKHAELLETLGLSLRVASTDVISIKAIPVLLEEADIRTLVTAVLEKLQHPDENSTPAEQLLAVITQGMGTAVATPSGSVMQRLLDDLDRTDLDTTQRHYKGMWRTLSIDELRALIYA